ncbi:hypothetical protein RB628_33810 [Streptomyces sp. ADMS]|nr:hypothetical protein [Streptomyces sp. ADMS]MDW4910175.1 hypothetical protein [Streptomyces sp. ADMS]
MPARPFPVQPVTFADLAAGELPEPGRGLAEEPAAWDNPWIS